MYFKTNYNTVINTENSNGMRYMSIRHMFEHFSFFARVSFDEHFYYYCKTLNIQDYGNISSDQLSEIAELLNIERNIHLRMLNEFNTIRKEQKALGFRQFNYNKGLWFLFHIDRILWHKWDPIGINDTLEARDEYTSYAIAIYKKILAGASVKEITDYLFKKQRNAIDTFAEGSVAQTISELIFEYFSKDKEPMKKIHIIGAPGSGKTYLSKKLAEKLNAPLLELDQIVWDNSSAEYNTAFPDDVRDAKLAEFIAQDSWIAEGIYYKWCMPSFDEADAIIILDNSKALRNFRIIKRFILSKLGLAQSNENSLKDVRALITWGNAYSDVKIPAITEMTEPHKAKRIFARSADEVLRKLGDK